MGPTGARNSVAQRVLQRMRLAALLRLILSDGL